MTSAPEQAFTVLLNLQQPERTLTLLAAGTGLRISECLGLQWQDVDFASLLIRVRRTWVHSHVGDLKTKASSAPVPMHPLLAESMLRWHRETPYSRTESWVFPSSRLKGRKPRCANMLVATSPAGCCQGWGFWQKRIRGALVFTTFVTVWLRFWCGARPIPRRCRRCYGMRM